MFFPHAKINSNTKINPVFSNPKSPKGPSWAKQTAPWPAVLQVFHPSFCSVHLRRQLLPLLGEVAALPLHVQQTALENNGWRSNEKQPPEAETKNIRKELERKIWVFLCEAPNLFVEEGWALDFFFDVRPFSFGVRCWNICIMPQCFQGGIRANQNLPGLAAFQLGWRCMAELLENLQLGCVFHVQRLEQQKKVD